MGSRIIGNGVENVYDAAQVWVDRCLRRDDSLFTPGEAIWTPRWLRELRGRFLDQPGAPGNGFLAKLENQLTGSLPEVYQLMGEVLFVHYLIISRKAAGGQRKTDNINRVLNWSAHPVTIPDSLIGVLSTGIAHPGKGFTASPYQLGFLIELAERLKEGMPAQERNDPLQAPWGFKGFAEAIQFQGARMTANNTRAQRYAVYHLVFPDTFERIVSEGHKSRIAITFERFVTEPTDDVDRKLQLIRRHLEETYGPDIDFYDDLIYAYWDPRRKDQPMTGILDGEELEEWDEIGVDYEALADDMYLPPDFIKTIVTLLEDKKQVIFQGPPGTGKTYVARALARHLAGADDRVTLVQFHPSYAYEDFVQGFRPTLLGDGQAGFELKDGAAAAGGAAGGGRTRRQSLSGDRRNQPGQPGEGARGTVLSAGVPRQ